MEGSKADIASLKLNLTVADVMLLVAGLPIDRVIYYSTETKVRVIITPEASLNEMITEENQRKNRVDTHEEITDLGTMDANEIEE